MAAKITTKEFPALNLPDLPEGYFWRFAEAGMKMDELQLRKKVLFFSVSKFSTLLFFYNVVKGKRVSIKDPKTNIEAASLRLNYQFTTGNPSYDGPRINVESIEIPKGVNLDDFENTVDKQYAQYRKDSK